METNNTQTTSAPSTPFKILAGIGVVALIILAILLGVLLVRGGGTAFQNLAAVFTSFTDDEPEQRLTLAADPGVIAPGDTVTLSWMHSGKEDGGSYAFEYPCTEDASVTINGQNVFCNKSFDVPHTTTALGLTIATDESFVVVPLEVHFTPNGQDTATLVGRTSVTVTRNVIATATTTTDITDEDEITTPVTPTPSTPTVSTPLPPTTVITTTGGVVSDPNGFSDLQVRILEVGTLSRSGSFRATDDRIDEDATIAIKFEIENVGTKTVASGWRFEVDMPTRPAGIYTAPRQDALTPGSKIEYVLGFDQAWPDRDDTITATIRIDSDKRIAESNESNNNLNVTIETKD